MPFPARARPVHRARAALMAAGLLALTTGAVLAQGGSTSPGDPGTGIPVSPSADGLTPFHDDATPAVPMPGGIAEPVPTGWDHVTIWPDGRTLTVYFWSGVEACYGLDRVELVDVGDTLSIRLYTGFRVDAANKRCIELAQLYSIDLTLEEPILGGGVEGIEGAQPTPGAAPELILPGTPLVQQNLQPWERVQVGPDGTSLMIWFTGGVQPCFDLERVAYEATGDIPTLLLTTGPSELDAACIALAVQYATPAALDAPILLGGLV